MVDILGTFERPGVIIENKINRERERERERERTCKAILMEVD
jgi:hypothetical protein